MIVKLFFFFPSDVGCQVDLRTVKSMGSTNNWLAQHVVNAPALGNQLLGHQIFIALVKRPAIRYNFCGFFGLMPSFWNHIMVLSADG